MALFSKQNKEVFTNPLNLDHPILGQVLGICSALAVTAQSSLSSATPFLTASVSWCSWSLWLLS